MSWRLAFHSTKLLFSYLIPYKVKAFRDAIFDAKLDVIRALAAERPRLLQQAIDADGNTALGLAILLGDEKVITTLLELGSNPDLSNAFDGNHPLVLLAKIRVEENSKTAKLADLLLDAGSNPLHEVRYQADNATRVDATQTPSMYETPLFCSIRFQNEELLRKMIDHGTDLNAINPETGLSPLMVAAQLGYSNICNMLLDAGADIKATDYAGNTSLHIAVQGYGEQVPVIQKLLERGADVDATNEDGLTAAAIAQRMQKDACFKLLDSHKSVKVLPPAYQEFEIGKEELREQSVFSYT